MFGSGVFHLFNPLRCGWRYVSLSEASIFLEEAMMVGVVFVKIYRGKGNSQNK